MPKYWLYRILACDSIVYFILILVSLPSTVVQLLALTIGFRHFSASLAFNLFSEFDVKLPGGQM